MSDLDNSVLARMAERGFINPRVDDIPVNQNARVWIGELDGKNVRVIASGREIRMGLIDSRIECAVRNARPHS